LACLVAAGKAFLAVKRRLSGILFFLKKEDFFLAFSYLIWYSALNLSGERKLIGNGARRKLTDFVLFQCADFVCVDY